MITNPYATINWDTVKYLKSTSHLHNGGQSAFEKSYNVHGQRHFPIINYLPSHATYPLNSFLANVPADAIGSPSSEKVKTSNGGGHFNAIGSFYNSPGHNWNIETDGPLLTWQQKFNNVLNQLQFEDGGGIILNHPDDLSLSLRTTMLAYDPRVLGIEIYNDSCDWYTSAPYYEGYCKDKYVPFWDSILKKGIRCWGYSGIDWYAPPERNWIDKGWMKLLVNNPLDEHEALKAFRNGNFFSVILDTGLIFTNIKLIGNNLTVSTNKSTKIKLVTDKKTTEFSGSTKVFALDGNEIYARIEAEDAEGGYIYSNPIMFKSAEDLVVNPKNNRLRNMILFGI